MPKTLDTGVADNPLKTKPRRFIDSKYLPPESLNDPDYRLKQLQLIYGQNVAVGCSKCHHCR